MKVSRQVTVCSLFLAVVLVAGVLYLKLNAAPQEDNAVTPASGTAATTSDTTTTTTATEPAASAASGAATASTAAAAGSTFAVPDGDVAEQFKFLDRVSKPTEKFTSIDQANRYWGQAAPAMKASAEKAFAGAITPLQAVRAAHFKTEALRIQSMLGDKNADKERNEFLDSLLKDPRKEVAGIVAPIRIMPQMRHWEELSVAQRMAAIDKFTADVKAGQPLADQASLLLEMGNFLADGPEGAAVVRAYQQLLPIFKASKDPAFEQVLPVLTAIDRRLNLPGNKLELEGTLLDGKPFDWEAYRGKVVLIDFWATWCPECLNEIPNVLQAYKQYRDKGFEIVGVCMDVDPEKAQTVMEQVGMTWPQLFSENPETRGWSMPVARKYGIMAIPRMILVDQEGKVVNMMANGPVLHAELEKLLGPVAADSPRLGSPEAPAKTAR